jgi:hypothetical protein
MLISSGFSAKRFACAQRQVWSSWASSLLMEPGVAANAALSASCGLEHTSKILEEAQAVDQAEDQAFGDSEAYFETGSVIGAKRAFRKNKLSFFRPNTRQENYHGR